MLLQKFIFLFILFLSVSIIFNAEAQINSSESIKNTNDAKTIMFDDRGKAHKNIDKKLKCSWELPSFREKYDVAKSLLWNEPNKVFNGYMLLSTEEDSDDSNTNSFYGYIAFRPFALDFGNSNISFGLSYSGNFGELDAENITEDKIIQGTYYDIEAIDGKIYTEMQSLKFSVLGNFPELGLQVLFEAGYARTRIRGSFDGTFTRPAVVFNDTPLYTAPVDTHYNDYKYEQEDESFFFFLEVKKFFPRNYLNFFRLVFYGNIPLRTRGRKSRAHVDVVVLDNDGNPIDGSGQDLGEVDLPTEGTLYEGNLLFETTIDLVDPQNKEFDNTFIAGNLSTRIVTFPVDVSFIPILKNQGISLDVLSGLKYATGELFYSDRHGASLSLGAQVSFFEAVAVSYRYTWEHRNDVENSWTVMLQIGLF